ncbi:uncharacterized protein LOC142550629 [Primulina tabacum]|uniref:uncharacterized protein LOC142550629 n=1 Tax=Primulina tabacum TaxID=48773 RepID=UPI003F5905D3
MEFLMGLHRTIKGPNAIWVIVDRLIKLAHFLSIKTIFSTTQYAEMYTMEIVRLHRIQVSSVSQKPEIYIVLLEESAFQYGDFIIQYTISSSDRWSDTDAYEVLYGKKCKSPIYWDEFGERTEIRPEIVQQTTDVVVRIRDRMKTAQSRYKIYAEKRIKDFEFAIAELVLMKIAPVKGVKRFDKKSKLISRFIGPFVILDREVVLAYRVALPPDLARVQNGNQVSMLYKYMSNHSYVLNFEPLHLTPNLSYEERPTQILSRQEWKARRKIKNKNRVSEMRKPFLERKDVRDEEDTLEKELERQD